MNWSFASNFRNVRTQVFGTSAIFRTEINMITTPHFHHVSQRFHLPGGSENPRKEALRQDLIPRVPDIEDWMGSRPVLP